MNNKLIIAGPGTGKTTALINNIFEASKKKDSKSFIISTFTRKAASELISRIDKDERFAESFKRKNNLINTIHSISHSLLTNFSNSVACEIISEDKLLRFIEARSTQIGLNDGTYNLHKLNNAMLIFNLITDNQIDPDDLRDQLADEEEEIQIIASSYSRYKNSLDRNKKYDFASIQLKLLESLRENSDFQNQVIENYSEIFIDEFQDINNIQNDIFNEFSNLGLNLTVVGDDDQSIYGFRGAVSEFLVNFEENHQDVEVEILETNYRSSKKIVELTNRMIQQANYPRLEKNIVAHDQSECSDVMFKSFKNDETEFRFIANKIRDLTNTTPFSYRDIAILQRSVKKDISLVMEIFENENIPIIPIGAGDLFLLNPIEEFLDLLRIYVHRDGTDEEIINRIERYPFHRENDSINKIYGLERSFFSSTSLVYKIFEICDFFPRYENNFGADLGLITDLAKTNDELQLLTTNFDTFNFLIYLEYLKNTNKISRAEDLDVNAVQFMTFHQSKGLEFPIVFMPQMNKFKPPPISIVDRFSVLLGQEPPDEFLRTHYVGASRAEKFLCMSYSKQKRKPNGEYSNYYYQANSIFEDLSHFYSANNNFEVQADNLDQDNFSRETVLSYNQIKTYRFCPKRYRYNNVFNLQTFDIGALQFGSNLHRSIEALLRNIKLGNLTVETILNDYEEQIDDIFYDYWDPNPINQTQEEQNRELAKEQIKSFLEYCSDDLTPDNIIGIEEPFDILLQDNIRLRGRIDAILNINGIKIIDYKTGQAENFTEFQEQLGIYKQCYLQKTNIEATTHIFKLSQGEMLDITTENENDLFSDIVEIGNLIRNGNFNVFDDRECTNCPYNKICSDRI